MKKLIVAGALILGTMTVSAQTETKEIVEKAPTQVTTQTETEVKTADVPVAITDAVKAGYPGAVINSVTVNGAKEYKVNLTMDGTTGVVYSDANGKWIKKD